VSLLELIALIPKLVSIFGNLSTQEVQHAKTIGLTGTPHSYCPQAEFLAFKLVICMPSPDFKPLTVVLEVPRDSSADILIKMPGLYPH
jgi:hypothetical protein